REHRLPQCDRALPQAEIDRDRAEQPQRSGAVYAGPGYRPPLAGYGEVSLLAGIHHVALIASDFARSRDFYVRILGLRVIAENYRGGRDSWKLDLGLPDS